MILLKGLFFIIIVGIVLFFATVFRLLWSARSLFNSLRGGHTQQRGTYGDTISTTDDTIIDHRSPEQTRRKIIDDGDGEYVEFEEVAES